MSNCRIKLIPAIAAVFLAAWAGGAVSQDACPFAAIYSDPMGTIGTKVECRARIEKVMSVSFPLGLLMRSGEFLWYSEVFERPTAKPGAIADGKFVFIRGQYISRKKVLYEGSLIDVPLVFVTGVEE